MKKSSLLVMSVLLAYSSMANSLVNYYGNDSSMPDVRFGGSVGAGVAWSPQTPLSNNAQRQAGFGGRTALSCSGIDFQGFLRGFNPNEYLNDMKNTMIGGAQSAATNYLLATAYANPTLASVLDMMNKSYTARFGAFQQACNAQESKMRGMDAGGRRMAEAHNQCFEAQVQQGASPTQAYQYCSNEETLGQFASSEKLAAAQDTMDFLKNNTSLNVTKEFESVLGLLPDERITENGHEMSPPKTTLYTVHRLITERSNIALNKILDGENPASIPDCGSVDLSDGSDPGPVGCLPMNAQNIVNAPAFKAAKQLDAPSRAIYTSALSSQVAISTIRSHIIELYNQLTMMDVKQGGKAKADDVIERRKSMMDEIERLQREADAMQSYQDAKAKMAKTQIMALERVGHDIENTRSLYNSKSAENSTNVGSLLKRFIGL